MALSGLSYVSCLNWWEHASRRIHPSPSVLFGPYLVLPIELMGSQPSNGVMAQVLLPDPHDIKDS